MSVPTTTKLTGSVTWADGTPFDGWLRLAMMLPQNSDGVWPSVTIAGFNSSQRIPLWIEVPITAGAFDTFTQVLLNSSISPENSQYVAYWYDRNNRRIFPATGTPPTPFTINSSSYSISIPTLTQPSTSVTVPTPQDDPTQGV